jgi:hypothetical protein
MIWTNYFGVLLKTSAEGVVNCAPMSWPSRYKQDSFSCDAASSVVLSPYAALQIRSFI